MRHTNDVCLNHCPSWELATGRKSANGRHSFQYALKVAQTMETKSTGSTRRWSKAQAKTYLPYSASRVLKANKVSSRLLTGRKCYLSLGLAAMKSSGLQELSTSG